MSRISRTPGDDGLGFFAEIARATSRRRFLQISGITLAVAAIGCDDDGDDLAGVDLGSGDAAVLNLAYAIEQTDSTFYDRVLDDPYEGMTDAERQIFEEVRDNEFGHREFLRTLLGDNAIPELELTFASVDFANRLSVIQTAIAFEDLGVSAYNGGGRLLVDPANLLAAGKIVSVEARHAAAFRDLLQPKSAAFAGDDVVDASGLDVVRTPQEALAVADPFVVTPVTPGNLP